MVYWIDMSHQHVGKIVFCSDESWENFWQPLKNNPKTRRTRIINLKKIQNPHKAR